MKVSLTLATVVLALVASFAPSRAREPAAGIVSTSRPGYAVRVGPTPVAILPSEESVVETKSDSMKCQSGITTLTGDAQVVRKLAGKNVVTISGAEITLLPKK